MQDAGTVVVAAKNGPLHLSSLKMMVRQRQRHPVDGLCRSPSWQGRSISMGADRVRLCWLA